MKYEISDLLNEKYKYGLTMLRMHKKADKGILFLLIFKLYAYNFYFVHILFIIISSMGLLILCNDFIPNYKKYIYFSNWLRNLTPHYLVKKLHISNNSYIIICSIIFFICILRILYTIKLMYKINHFQTTKVYNIKENIFVKILNHIVYIFFSYIIEFLSYILYIEFFPNDFIIKKNNNINDILQKIFCIINIIFIIIYNINNFFFISVTNRPYTDESYPLKMKIPSSKLYIFILLQNFSLLHPLQCYFSERINNIWCVIYIIILFLLLLWLYLIQIKSYNYDNIINSILSFIGEFCFISIIIEMILHFFSIRIESRRELIYFLFVKIGVSICLFFCLKKIYQKLMIKTIRKRIFYNNPYNHPFDIHLINSILFIRELFSKKNMKYLNKINGFLIEHKKQCSNNNCGCKIIKTEYNIKKGDKIGLLEDLKKKLNYYIESILIHYNYQNNLKLSILLSEHFFLYKNNPIMSYSILQTLLQYNYKSLNKNELITIYELMNKYIKLALMTKIKYINLEKYIGKTKTLNKIIKEIELKQYFNLILKIKKTIKYMKFYSSEFITIIKHKDNYENSAVIKMDEIYNELKYISAPYLNEKLLREILDFLSIEITYTSDIDRYLYDLKEYNKILTYEFLYKIFLFVDYFWIGQIPDKLMDIFYSFTSNRNLYSTEINPDIYIILEKKIESIFNHSNKKFYILFKYTKNIKISYVSESLSRKLFFKQSELINNDIDVLFIKDLIEPHNNIIKYFFILQQNNVLKDKYKYIFDNRGYMINSKMNSTLQIGINKNILIITTVEINQNNNEIRFYANKNLYIVSINKNFQDYLSLSLALIKEFKIELKDLFGIDDIDININSKKELKKIKQIKEYKILDTKEYILKNLFKTTNQNSNYHINNKYINNESNDKESELDNDEEEILLKDKKKKKDKYKKFIQNILNDKTTELLHIHPIYIKISKEEFLNNLRKIFEKINSYEQDKLERKNIYDDFVRLTNNYNELSSYKNMTFNIKIEPKLLYDTSFYSCKVDLYMFQNIIEINSNQRKLYELKNFRTETEDLNSTYNNSKIYDKTPKMNDLLKKNMTISNNREGNKYNKNCQTINNNCNFFKEKIKKNKAPKFKLCAVLLFCIFVLLISCIITLRYQTNLVHKNDKIFDAIFYNYYQRTQFIYLNSILLSIFYELLEISKNNALIDNKDVLHLIGKNIENSHQLFQKYYMDFKIELNEDFSKLYEPLMANKITVNWENKLFNNDYNSELTLIVYRILDSIKHEFNNNDIIDCQNLLLGHYLNIDRKNTTVNGNFIKLVYYFYINYDPVLRKYFLILEDSFENSLNDFSKQTTEVYSILEVIAIISFLLFFAINMYFLITSNKYIFQNILYMFIDFSQLKEYSFNNKYYNSLVIKKVTNFISLLNEFNPKNLELLKTNKETDEISNIKNTDVKFVIDEEQNLKSKNKQNINSKIKKKDKKKEKSGKKASNEIAANSTTLLNINSYNNLINTNNNNNTKGLKMLNDDIHILNNKELNDISNNSINNMNTSKLSSTNINLYSSSLINSNNNISNKNTNNMVFFLNANTIINNSSNIKNNISINSNSDNYNKNQNQKINEIIINEDLKLTIDKILFKTKITMLNSVKFIMLIFIIFTFIFVVYLTCKLIISFVFISNFQDIMNDFKILTSQYNHIIHYWNKIKTLFILPKTILEINLNETEDYFTNLNYKVNVIYKNRIKRYKRISNLYNIILSSSLDNNLSSIDFCLNHTRCYYIRNSNKNLLSNGIESTVNLYAKEISNYYKDFLELKNNLTDKNDIIKHFVDEKYSVLSSNINHVIIFLEELFFKYFLQDEVDIVNNFYFKIKILNIVEICYCALLNLFSVFFVYNYITRIISSVEVASTRINSSIRRIKLDNNY